MTHQRDGRGGGSAEELPERVLEEGGGPENHELKLQHPGGAQPVEAEMCASPSGGWRHGAGRSHEISPCVCRLSTKVGHVYLGREPSVVEGGPREAARGSTVRLLLRRPPPAPSSCPEKQVHTLFSSSLFCLMFPMPSSDRGKFPILICGADSLTW